MSLPTRREEPGIIPLPCDAPGCTSPPYEDSLDLATHLEKIHGVPRMAALRRAGAVLDRQTTRARKILGGQLGAAMREARRKEAPMSCSICRKPGHNAKSCPGTKLPAATGKEPTPAKLAPPVAGPVPVTRVANGAGPNLDAIRAARELCEERVLQYTEAAENLRVVEAMERTRLAASVAQS